MRAHARTVPGVVQSIGRPPPSARRHHRPRRAKSRNSQTLWINGYAASVALRVQVGTAFRWRPTALHGEANDVVRVVDGVGGTLVLLANGYECGFSTCWPPASRLVLDLFADAWRRASGPTHSRLLDAFSVTRATFAERAPALIAPDADFPDELPAAVLLAAVIDGSTAHLAWIGGDVALVVRDAKPLASTTPHTLLEQIRREHPGADLSALPDVVVRDIAPRSADPSPPDHLAIEVAPGDALILLSRTASRGPGIAVQDIAAATAQPRTPSALAEQLADAAFADGNAPYAATAVLRVEASP